MRLPYTAEAQRYRLRNIPEKMRLAYSQEELLRKLGRFARSLL
jgi:hypothetical protein